MLHQSVDIDVNTMCEFVMLGQAVAGRARDPDSVAVVFDAASRPRAGVLAALARDVVSTAEYVAFIGPDAEAVHDEFDQFVIERLKVLGRADAETVPMTVWEECEELDEGVRLLDEEHYGTMSAFGEVVVIGPPELWARLVEIGLIEDDP